ncbi:MAG: ABC transporter ATP-binding protein [Chitinophagaceae bacterium]|jgi:ABC-type multidrug transport system ATPase subunit|nr:ABC transporter ATP-binding protein [Chitinophagaceae bacterium]
MDQPLISVSGLCKQFDDLKAVDNLSFSVFPGDIYGFLGQNGAGKSTTIRMLLTLIQPTAGTIEMFGYTLPHHRSEILSGIGAIIERPDMYKYLSAYENLSMFAQLSGLKVSRSQLMEQLEKVGLAERANSKVKTFSQGMKQRLGIAISLIHDPQLIILDEPTNGLDPQGIADMRKLILALRSEHKKTVIVSSHLLSEIELVATRMIIIHKGRKIVEGSTGELFDPADTLVELETSDDNAIEKIRKSAWNNVFQKEDEKLLFRLHAREVPSLAKDLVEMDIPLNNFSRRHSLEHLFLKLTAEATLATK